MLHIQRPLVFAVPQRRGTNTNVHQRLQGKEYSLVKGRRYEHTLPVRGFAHCSVAYSRRTVIAKLEHRGVGPSLIRGRACEADLPTELTQQLPRNRAIRNVVRLYFSQFYNCCPCFNGVW